MEKVKKHNSFNRSTEVCFTTSHMDDIPKLNCHCNRPAIRPVSVTPS
jgi:hypothetical protein